MYAALVPDSIIYNLLEKKKRKKNGCVQGPRMWMTNR
jgi:hypothetical protein